MANKDSGWWDELYPAFRQLFDRIPAKVTNAEVRYLVKKLDLKKGMTFLDCPCGIGRISLPLAKKGIHVTGVDFMASYLDEVDAKARRGRLPVKLVRSDMRRINFDGQFDVAANLWTSFGYFSKESDNKLVLKKIFKALKPGGKFLLHVINRDWIVANFTSRGWEKLEGGFLLEDREFDYRTSTSISTWNFLANEEKTVFRVQVRMYSYHELVSMFESVGFVDIEGFGNLEDEPITHEHRMMFVFGTKPKGK